MMMQAKEPKVGDKVFYKEQWETKEDIGVHDREATVLYIHTAYCLKLLVKGADMEYLVDECRQGNYGGTWNWERNVSN